MDVLSASSYPIVNPAGDPGLLASQASSKEDRAIEKAASGFESMFLTQLLKEMRQTLEPDTLFGQDSGDVLGGLFDMYMSQHLASSGALGIAAIVRKHLTAQKSHLNAYKQSKQDTSQTAVPSAANSAR